MTITQTENPDQFEAFDGELLHPSLDIKNQILSIGFRYRINAQEEADIFVVANDNQVEIIDTESFKRAGKLYFFEKRGRQLMRIEERWNLNELKKFINLHAEFKSETLTSKELFSSLVDLAKRHIELEHDIDYHLLVAWILGTYFYPIFSAYPFLHVKAPKRSGKSQCLNFLGQLCFNAVKSRPSLPALGDTVDSLRGTYLIDQADSLERKGGEELLDVLADSYKKSGGKRRIINFDKRRGRETLEFETYSPKVFASIKELPEDLRDRCLAIGLIRSQKNFPDPDDSGINWREIRGSIYKYLISNYSVIEGTYTVRKIGYREKREKIGRSLELWLPFEVILACFNQENKIEEGWKRFSAQYGFSEYEPNELEEAVIKAIMEQLVANTEAILTPMEISRLVDSEAFTVGETSKQNAVKVGWTIKKFNLSLEKKARTKNGVSYLFEKNRVDGIFQSYFKNVTEHTPLTQEGFDAVNTEGIDM